MYILIFVVIILLVQSMVEPSKDVASISYSELIIQIKNNNVKSLSFTDSQVNGVYKDDTKFTSYIPTLFLFSGRFYDDYLADRIEAEEIEIIGEPDSSTSYYRNVGVVGSFVVCIHETISRRRNRQGNELRKKQS